MTEVEFNELVLTYAKCIRKIEKTLTEMSSVLSAEDLSRMGEITDNIYEELGRSGNFNSENFLSRFKETGLYKNIRFE